MTKEQPTALRLAEELDRVCENGADPELIYEAAAELRRLHVENEALQKALRLVIRTYRVADEVWDPDAETERLYQRELKK